MIHDLTLSGYSLGIAAPPSVEVVTNPTRIFVRDIQAEVARYYHIDPRHMQSSARWQDVSHPRQVAMYLARKLTKKSLPQLGRMFGGRDHSTVIHAIRAVEKRMLESAETFEDVTILHERLTA